MLRGRLLRPRLGVSERAADTVRRGRRNVPCRLRTRGRAFSPDGVIFRGLVRLGGRGHGVESPDRRDRRGFPRFLIGGVGRVGADGGHFPERRETSRRRNVIGGPDRRRRARTGIIGALRQRERLNRRRSPRVSGIAGNRGADFAPSHPRRPPRPVRVAGASHDGIAVPASASASLPFRRRVGRTAPDPCERLDGSRRIAVSGIAFGAVAHGAGARIYGAVGRGNRKGCA